TLTVPYHLRSKLNGTILAAAGNADENLNVNVELTMGVSDSGIPLSPATLVLPHYAQYLDPSFISDNTLLFGLGYSLATAPLSERTAAKPRVIRDDVFRRAQDLARAGQRIFIRRADAGIPEPAAERDPLFDLSLDLLGNVERPGYL